LRVPSFSTNNDGINTRVGAELLVQNNVWEDCDKGLYSTDSGYANASGNDFGGASNTAETSKFECYSFPFIVNG
jgi:pectate lyase